MVFREEMQKSILTALALKGCFNRIVFKGGTALHLFHGNPRFSEDIDLVLNDTNGLRDANGDGQGYELTSFLPGVEKTVRDTFPFIDVVEIRTQKNDLDLQRYVLVSRSDDPDHTLRIHIELAAILSYRNRPRILDFPPVHPAVRVEDIDEILADKICALALRPYLKGRDLWDIYYLTHDRSVTVDWSLVQKKVKDYSGQVSERENILGDGIERARAKIRNDGSSILRSEMERFLPKYILESYRSSFDTILESVINITTGNDADPGSDDP